MAIIVVTIPIPPLNLGETFDVSHRLVGSSTWIPDGPQTNDPFNVDIGTAFGQYEFLVERENCDPFIFCCANIFEACNCPVSVTAQLIRKTGSITVIRFTMLAISAPPCGWQLEYTPSGGPMSVIYPSTLTSPFEVVVIPNKDYFWTLKINCCGDEISVCSTGQLASAATIDECDSVVLENELTPPAVSHAPSFDGVDYYFEFNLQQSDPVSPVLIIKYGQTLGGDNGTVPVVPVPSGDPTYPWKVRFIVHPHPGQGGYSIGVSDVCLEGWVVWY